MQKRSIGRIIFDGLLFLMSLYFYLLSGKFTYVATPGQLGPDFWPKLILILLMLLAVYDIIIGIYFKGGEGIESSSEEKAANKYPLLLAIGSILTIGYVYLVSFLGFPLTTFLYLIAFMYIGRYRKMRVIVASSFVTVIVLVLIFVKFVYVSLPLGEGVFADLTILLYRLLGIY
ncbi:Tripartite tricarboxylate transporter TctB family protein [Thermanaeromonas toyohensis ToBE]|uniref:Tripartite tricarboxylate transporter TctB family protein n=1 Tax=Thermanaeromonas toyohensis ToBE TaxID=698762 RepID=A0A1W1VKF9_9FIRM|nr:tripartite tricarboxylate transporter TctB family protein [Thermanaeromonas toyohensis]SMB93710.1 Tripartite tricarboxylate transporter TctB family protein [Thermanaeromonas toyohensis ToBE]